MPKSLREVQSFMDRERLASFVTVDPYNKPHVVPVFSPMRWESVYTNR